MDAGLHAGERAVLGNTITSAGYDRQRAQHERSARQDAKYTSPPMQHAGDTLGDILAVSLRNDGRQAAASGNAPYRGATVGSAI
jgi:hypothetical protein